MALKDLLLNIPTKIGNVTNKVGSTLGQALIGKQELPIEYVNIKGVDTNSPEFAENMPVVDIAVTENPRVGGLLNDIRSGAKENFATGFAAPNWEETITPDGRKKGMGYRFGEGLGSLARFADSPLGRGLMMAGVVGAAGGSGLEALAYGGGAGLLNQQNRMKDTMYRNELGKMGFDTSGIRGYISDDTFNKIFQSKQLEDNAKYRSQLLESNLKDRAMTNAMAQQRLDYQKIADAEDRALKKWELSIKEKEAGKPKPLSDSQVKDLKGTTDFLTSLENIETRYNNPKYDSMFGIKGDIRRNNPLSRYDAEASLFKQDVEILRQRYAKLLEGGRLSDSDRAFYQKALFNPNVSRADFLEAVRRMKQTLQQDYNNALSMYAKQGKDIAGFELTPTMQTQATTNEGWAF